MGSSPEPVHMVHPDGREEWTVGGHRHRVDGPAVTWPGGSAEWWFEGQLHREDGPALWYRERQGCRGCQDEDFTHPRGHSEWWCHGVIHRTDGPAIEIAGVRREWLVNGRYHRTDGPAVEYANGDSEWYFHGQSCDWQPAQAHEFLALPAPAREFVAAHVLEVEVWSTWEDLFASAVEATTRPAAPPGLPPVLAGST